MAEETLFLYGSMTGNAENICRRLHHEAVAEHGLASARCLALNDVVKQKLLDKYLYSPESGKEAEATSSNLSALRLIIVCSTTGEGEPPENAARFRRWLRNLKLRLCAAPAVRYTVLAIGDTNYNNFCAAGIWIDVHLEEAGGIRFFPRGEADDAVDVGSTVEPWSAQLWQSLRRAPGAEVGRQVFKVGYGQEFMEAEGGINPEVALETAIIYANASNICASLALFLLERIVELGGKADLYPIQYFKASHVRQKPVILLFLLSTESDEVTICQDCQSATRLPPLGPFAQWFLPQNVAAAESTDDTTLKDIQEWMADPEIQYYASLCVVGGCMESAPFATRLNEVVHQVAESCKLQCLIEASRGAAAETKDNDKRHCGSIALGEEEVFGWTESVLESLPGVTTNKNAIRMSMDFFFSSRVGAALVSGREPSLQSDFGNGSSSAVPRRRHHHLEDETENQSSSGTKQKTNKSFPEERNEHNEEDPHGKGHVSISGLLTPLVFLFAGGSSLAAEVACDIHSRAASHHLRGSLTELGNFRSTGFPRQATFVFIVSGELTKGMVRTLRTIRFLQKDGASFDRVRFAVLGIEESRDRDEAFNACALELESVLLSLNAQKIHCTGLADGTRREDFLKVVSTWEESLWSAVTHPTPSMAYLDECSPNIGSEQTALNNLFPQPNAWFNPFQADEAAVDTTQNVIIRPSAAPALFEQIETSPFPLPMAVRVPQQGSASHSSANSLPQPTSLFGQFAAAQVEAPMPPPASSLTLGASGTNAAQSAFPYDSVPLRRENVPYTPVLIAYSSAGMAKTMANFTKNVAYDLGFPTRVGALHKLNIQDFVSHPNVILFCESRATEGSSLRSGSYMHLRQQLSNPLVRPDYLSHLRFAILGLGKAPSERTRGKEEDHPVSMWTRLLMRLQANRVFPSAFMTSMSLIHSLGVPWTECVLSSFAVMPPTTVRRPTTISWMERAHPNAMPPVRRVSNAVLPAGPLRQSEFLQDTLGEMASAELEQQGSVLFLYGSSTGMAEAIARDLHREAQQRGIPSRVAALQFFDKMNFLTSSVVAIVCSTFNTNKGGYPDNARRFGKYIHHREHLKRSNSLHGMRYAVLGLGNAVQYPQTFCLAAVGIDRRLDEMGAERVCPLGRVDVSTPILHTVESWRKDFFHLVEAIAQEEQLSSMGEAAGPPLIVGGAAVPFHPSALRPQQFVDVSSKTGKEPQDGKSAVSMNVGALVLYAGKFDGPVSDVSARLVTLLQSEELQNQIHPVEVWTMNSSIKKNWRRRFRYIIFVVYSDRSSTGNPLHADAFHTLLHLRGTPTDMFCGVLYSVLTIASHTSQLGDALDSASLSTPSRRFVESEEAILWGRQLDRRIEELGGTRLFGRGEVLGQQYDPWIRGLCEVLRATAEVDKACRQRLLAGRESRSEGKQTDQRSSPSTALSTEAETAKLLDSRESLPNHNSLTGKEKTETFSKPLLASTSPLKGSQSQLFGIGMDAEGTAENKDLLKCTIHSWRCLTTPPSGTNETPTGSVFQVNFNVPNNVTWLPGQTVEVTPMNLSHEVEELLRLFRLSYSEDFIAVMPSDVLQSSPQAPLDEKLNASMPSTQLSLFPGSPLYSAVNFPSTCGVVLQRYVSLSVTRQNKGLFDLLLQQPRLTASSREQLENCLSRLRQRTITAVDLTEVLQMVCPASATPPFQHVAEQLSLLQPRVYSIASSARYHSPPLLTLCVKVVHKGLCSNWLYEQCLSADHLQRLSKRVSGELYMAQRSCTVSLSLRPLGAFRFPVEEPEVPVIFIGPGTGIAPFRAFLQERHASMASERHSALNHCTCASEAVATERKAESVRCQPPCVSNSDEPLVERWTPSPHFGAVELFFGCRRADEDFLFREELSAFERNGVLTAMQVAFSRQPNNGHFWYGGCYVQDLLVSCGLGVCELLITQKANVLVCGDAAGMAQDVLRAFIDMLQNHLRCTAKSATEYMEQLMKTGRYMTDVWST